MQSIVTVAIVAMITFAVIAVIYAVAPILIPFLLVVGVLGVVTWGIVRVARSIEHRRNIQD
jgi:hypothetical protein